MHKMFPSKLKPTPAQERALTLVLRRCHELYNAALQERRDAWRMRRVGVTQAIQSAQLPAVKAVRPEHRDIHSQVLQDVLTRLDRALQAFFRRVRAGQTLGYPRFKNARRYRPVSGQRFAVLHRDHNAALNIQRLGQCRQGAVTAVTAMN